MENQNIVKQIETVYIPVTDTFKSAEWYRQHLGLSLIRPVSDGQAQLKVGDSQTIFLIKTNERTTLNYIQNEGIEMSALTLEVYRVEELYEQMKQIGQKIDELEDAGGWPKKSKGGISDEHICFGTAISYANPGSASG